MFEVWYQENGEIPALMGKYRTIFDASDACAAKEQTIVRAVNPYWFWVTTPRVRIWSRRAGAEMPPADAVYCGRPSGFGNPFEVGKHGLQGECCNKFDAWLTTGETFDNPAATEVRRQWILDRVHQLHGRDLICWCAPKRCHCETLARLAN